jgi:hypothetical protein
VEYLVLLFPVAAGAFVLVMERVEAALLAVPEPDPPRTTGADAVGGPTSTGRNAPNE